jgi:SAM-dependent methyltransferase
MSGGRKFVCRLFLVAAAVVGAGPSANASAQGTDRRIDGRVPDIGFAPTPYVVAEAMLKLARVGPADVVYDLGSGDGRIVNLAARLYGARGVGIELQPSLVALSRRAAVEGGVSDKVTFIEGDLFTADISNATVVTLYLWPAVNRALEAKLKRELRPGTRIVSHSFDIGGWIPEQTVQTQDGTQLFLWTVPRRPERTPDVGFTATTESVVSQMLELGSVGPDDVVYDLGSGDGRIPILAAQRYGAHAVGIEIDPPLVELARQVAHDNDLDGKVVFQEGDLFSADISKATVVMLYLSAAVNRRLEQKLRRDLIPGTRIVSHQFPIGTWSPEKVVHASDGTDLFLWRVPARR